MNIYEHENVPLKIEGSSWIFYPILVMSSEIKRSTRKLQTVLRPSASLFNIASNTFSLGRCHSSTRGTGHLDGHPKVEKWWSIWGITLKISVCCNVSNHKGSLGKWISITIWTQQTVFFFQPGNLTESFSCKGFTVSWKTPIITLMALDTQWLVRQYS